MSEQTRCRTLVLTSITSPGDINLNTPQGHTNTTRIPASGYNIASKMYVDAAMANLTLVGTALTCTLLESAYYINETVVLPTAELGAIAIVPGMRILLAGAVPAGIYAATTSTTLRIVVTLANNDAVFVEDSNSLWYLQHTTLVQYVRPAGNIVLFPTTPNIAEIISALSANATGMLFVLSAGAYSTQVPITLAPNTTVFGYGATITTSASSAFAATQVENVRIAGPTIHGSTTTAAGILFSGVTGATIADCTVATTTTGISIIASTDCHLVSTTVSNATQTGIEIRASANISVTGCRVHDVPTGIECDAASDTVHIAHCAILATNVGVHLAKCSVVDLCGGCISNNVVGIVLDSLPDGPTLCRVSAHIVRNLTGIVATGSDPSNIVSGRCLGNTANVVGYLATDAVPAGLVQILPAQTIPPGWLLCDGTAYSQNIYRDLYDVLGRQFGGTATTFNVPDLRNMFVRGYSSAANRGFATVQPDAFKAHTHDADGAGLAVAATTTTGPSINTYTDKSTIAGISLPLITMTVVGDTETRPVNVNLNYIIKC